MHAPFVYPCAGNGPRAAPYRLPQLLAVKEDFEHKLALQLAENRRLQSQISVQRSELNTMAQKLHEMEQRVAEVEADIGA